MQVVAKDGETSLEAVRGSSLRLWLQWSVPHGIINGFRAKQCDTYMYGSHLLFRVEQCDTCVYGSHSFLQNQTIYASFLAISIACTSDNVMSVAKWVFSSRYLQPPYPSHLIHYPQNSCNMSFFSVNLFIPFTQIHYPITVNMPFFRQPFPPYTQNYYPKFLQHAVF